MKTTLNTLLTSFVVAVMFLGAGLAAPQMVSADESTSTSTSESSGGGLECEANGNSNAEGEDVDTNANTNTNCDGDTNGGDHKPDETCDTSINPEEYLSVKTFDPENGTVTIENTSENCDGQKVGIAAYKGFGNDDGSLNIGTQELFDDETTMLDAGEEKTLDINVPHCAYQFDLFRGHVIQDFAAEGTYGDRLIETEKDTFGKPGNGAALVNTGNLCGTPDPDPTPECVAADKTSKEGVVLEVIDLRSGEVKITNNSDCVKQVGIASYKGFSYKFEDSMRLDVFNQELFDDASEMLESGDTAHFDIDVPSCAYQVDAFTGEVIDFSTGMRYHGENRALHEPDGTPGHASYNESNLCDDGSNPDPDPEPNPVVCTLDESDYDYFVNFEGENNELFGSEGRNHQSYAVSLNLPEGEYTARLQGGDAYEGREDDNQDHEQFFVAFGNDNGYFNRTGATDDLADGVDSAKVTQTVNTGLVIDQNVTNIRARHEAWYNDDVERGTDSIEALCAGFNKNEEDDDDDDEDDDDDGNDDDDDNNNNGGGGGGQKAEPVDDDDDDNGEVRGEDTSDLGDTLDEAEDVLSGISDEIDDLENNETENTYPGVPHTGAGGAMSALLQTLGYALVLVLFYGFYAYLKRKRKA